MGCLGSSTSMLSVMAGQSNRGGSRQWLGFMAPQAGTCTRCPLEGQGGRHASKSLAPPQGENSLAINYSFAQHHGVLAYRKKSQDECL